MILQFLLKLFGQVFAPINSFTKKLWAMFGTQPGGFSIRKVIAFVFMCFVAYCHKFYVNEKNVITVILIDVGTILVLLSIVTIDQITRFKNGIPDDKSNPPTPSTNDQP